MQNIIFALGTGRCGTKTLCHLFKQLPGVESYHEPRPSLSRVASFRLALIDYDVQKTIRIARDPLLLSDRNLNYLESSLWNTWLIDDLIALIPHVRFIWLYRDLFTWAQSCYRRGWYDPVSEQNQERFAKLRPVPPAGWPAGVSRWFMLGYYWGLYNLHAQQRLLQHRAPWVKLAVEDLNSLEVVNSLVDWCGFPGRVTTLERENAGSDRITLDELKKRNLYDTLELTGINLEALKSPASWVSVSYLKKLGIPFEFEEINPITPQVATDLKEGVGFSNGIYSAHYSRFTESRQAKTA